MKNQRMRVVLTVLVMGWISSAQCQSDAPQYAYTDGVVVDEKIYQLLESQSRKLLDDQQIVAFPILASQLEKGQCTVKQPRAASKPLSNSELYQTTKESVLVIGTLYKCSHCPKDHVRSATGFVIGEEGIGVTSYHIFRGQATNENTDLAVVAMDLAGNVYPIKEVMAANKTNDLAIFRFDTGKKKLKPLALGEDARVGEAIGVVAHPHSMYYSFTQGAVSRLYWRDGGEKMTVTADFAQGSSGGPVLDSKGNVVGVVSATLSLYNTDQHLQMVSKEAIPVKAIRALITQ